MQELDVATKAQGDQRQALYRIYLGLAGSHETRHQYAEAETYYQSACNVAKTLFGSQSDDVVKALNLIGEMRLHQGRVAEAEQVFHQALKIVESNPDIPRMATAAVLNNLAAVQHMTGNVSRAIALLRKVVATVENDPAVSEEVFGTALSNLAITLREGGTVPEAMATAKRAVSLLECCKDSDHFAVSLVTLSRLHLDQGDSASAEAVLLRALSTIESASKEDSPTQALIFAHLGVLYGGIGRPRQAEPYFQRAIEIERRLLGPEHPTLLDSMDAYAAFLRATNRRGDAKKLEAYVREQREKYRLQNPAVANVVDVNSLMRRRSH
ncbi:MAG: Tfp pilus assembly protein PilF [Bryobacterales bacterium]|nr:Tfp pilus assembly protein PilF [Bryobacterales bacterium]